VKEKPILFSGPMVRAILEGRKTQTRRVMKVQAPSEIQLDDPSDHGFASTCAVLSAGPSHWFNGDMRWTIGASWGSQPCPPRDAHKLPSLKCPYGQPGDKLWVRETWAVGDRDNDVLYAADPSWNVNGVALPPSVNKGTVHAGNWRPSIHMPRWASRITLNVTAVRVERLQAISEDDARAEGVTLGIDGQTGRLESGGAAFLKLWNIINAERGYGWTVNPWVWVISFHLLEARNDR